MQLTIAQLLRSAATAGEEGVGRVEIHPTFAHPVVVDKGAPRIEGDTQMPAWAGADAIIRNGRRDAGTGCFAHAEKPFA
jgi:hypothetical protein